MSEESPVYGCIVGTHGSTADWYGLYPLNRAVVDALPVEDDYPPLARGVFYGADGLQAAGVGLLQGAGDPLRGLLQSLGRIPDTNRF